MPVTRRRMIGAMAGLVALSGAARPGVVAQDGATPLGTPREGLVPAPRDKTELVIGHVADVSTLDPHLSTSRIDTTVTFNIFDNLVARDRNLSLQPRLATS